MRDSEDHSLPCILDPRQRSLDTTISLHHSEGMSATKRYLDALTEYENVKRQQNAVRATPAPDLDDAIRQVDEALKAVIREELNDQASRAY